MKNWIKKTAQGALIVPALMLAALGAVTTVSTTYAAPGDGICDVTTGVPPIGEAADCTKSTDQSQSLTGETGVFKTITNVLLFIIGAISVIMLIIGGIRYTVSGGDSSAVTSAKNTILYAIVGIVVALLAYAVVNFVLGSFSTGA
jgi:hypothetical protein